MIRHIVMFSAKDHDDLEEIYNGLKILEKIQGNWTLEVKKNIKKDQIDNNIDIVVYGEFPDQETLETYKATPIYQEAVSIVRPLRELRIAADIIVKD